MSCRYIFVLAALAILCGAPVGYTQQESAKVTASIELSDSTIAVGEQLLVTSIVTGPHRYKGFYPTLNELPDFVKTKIMTVKKTYMDNSEIMSSETFKFIYAPEKAGEYYINSKIRNYNSHIGAKPDDKRIIVTPSQASSAKSEKRQTLSAWYKFKLSEFHTILDNDGEIFVEASVDNDNPYVGDQITFTCAKLHNTDLSFIKFNEPTTAGFWSISFPDTLEWVQKEGKQYSRKKFRKILFPTVAGNLEIGEFHVNYYYKKGTLDQLGELFTAPVPVKVKALPEKGKPSHFTGVVGDFAISSEISQKEVAVGEDISIRVTVTGTGNLDMISNFIEPDFSEYRFFSKNIIAEKDIPGRIIGGSKTWEYKFAPLTQGKAEIEPFVLSYFNTADESYHTVTTKPFTIAVTGKTNIDAAQPTVRYIDNSVGMIALDIRYIKPDVISLKSSKKGLIDVGFLLHFYILPLTIFLAAYSVKELHVRRRVYDSIKKNLISRSRARKSLSSAEKLASGGNYAQCAVVIRECLHDYLADALNIDMEAVAGNDLHESLILHKVSQAEVDTIFDTLKSCDRIEYSQTDKSDGQCKAIIQELKALIRQMNKSL